MITIGSDYDDTWTLHPEIRGNVDVIVTGNTWEAFEVVMGKYEGRRVPIFFNPLPKGVDEVLSNIVSHKSNIINTLKLDKFYEDQPEQVRLLQLLCPNCKLVLVHQGKTAI